METKVAYINFNNNKTIQEIRHVLIQKQETLQILIKELKFYRKLLNAPIYKPQSLNLFEILERFKSKVEKSIQQTKTIVNKTGMQLIKIDKYIKASESFCHNLLGKEIDALECEIFYFLTDIKDLKSEMLEYLQEVIIVN